MASAVTASHYHFHATGNMMPGSAPAQGPVLHLPSQPPMSNNPNPVALPTSLSSMPPSARSSAPHPSPQKMSALPASANSLVRTGIAPFPASVSQPVPSSQTTHLSSSNNLNRLPATKPNTSPMKSMVAHSVSNSSAPLKALSTSAPLVILKQTSQSEECVTTADGQNKNIHVVVKNAPFIIQVGLGASASINNRSLNLNHFAFEVALFYDSDKPPFEKAVDYVKVKPVEHKSKMSEQGNQATLEVRIKVLTSQHECSLFRVKVCLVNPGTGELCHPSMVAFSEPIKVISKPEQIKKNPAPSAKRSYDDLMIDFVARIEETQKEQQRIIEKLLDQTKKNQQNLDSSFTLDIMNGSEFVQVKEEPVKKENDFETCFATFLSVFTNTHVEERPTKIRRLVRNSTTQDTEKMVDLLEHLNQSTQRFPDSQRKAQRNPSMNSCNCNVCPYQKELERIDELYKEDFLSSPFLDDLLVAGINQQN